MKKFILINHKKFDFLLLGLLVALIVVGFLAIFTASTTVVGDQVMTANNWWKQIIFAGIALLAVALLLRLPMPIFDILILPAFVLNLLALIIVLFTPAMGGAHRWLSIANVHFQPSESAKLLTILMVARYISKENLGEYKQILYGFGIMIVPVILIIDRKSVV